MTSLASKHDFHFDDASSGDTVARNPLALGAGIAAALGALVLGAAAGLGDIQAPVLNPGPEPEQLTERWQPDPETGLAFAVRAEGLASMTPGVTAEPATAAQAPAALEAEGAPASSVVVAPPSDNTKSGATDNPY